MTQAPDVARFFHSYAKDFDAIYGNRNTFLNRIINKFFRVSMRLRFEKTIAGCDPIKGKSVVDIGTGPGHYAIALAQRGASRVLGLDFAEGMIRVAEQHAQHSGVSHNCQFVFGDFLKYEFNEKFDYAVVMGFMDYIAEPQRVIDKVLAVTTDRAFFSFPVAGGLLAWQRKLRYRQRCDLFLYTRPQIEKLFASSPAARVAIQRIHRDFFVTAFMQ